MVRCYWHMVFFCVCPGNFFFCLSFDSVCMSIAYAATDQGIPISDTYSPGGLVGPTRVLAERAATHMRSRPGLGRENGSEYRSDIELSTVVEWTKPCECEHLHATDTRFFLRGCFFVNWCVDPNEPRYRHFLLAYSSSHGTRVAYSVCCRRYSSRLPILAGFRRCQPLPAPGRTQLAWQPLCSWIVRLA